LPNVIVVRGNEGGRKGGDKTWGKKNP